MRKILVSRTDAIGDLLLTTPLIRELKKSSSGNYIAVLAGKYAAPVLYNNPDIDEIIEYDKSAPKAAVAKVKKGGFDTVIAAYPRFELASLFLFSGIKERYGTAFRWYSPMFFNRRINIHRKNSEMSEADYSLKLAQPIIGEKKAEKEYYYPQEDELVFGSRYAAGKGLANGFVMIHPGGRGSSINLSAEKYAEIACAIEGNTGLKVLLSGGSPEEKEIISAIKKNTGSLQIAALDENISLRQFAGIIARAAVFVSGSTGPMHIAAALNVATVSFFPPDSIAATRAKRWGPLGNRYYIFKPESEGAGMDSLDTASAVKKIAEAAGR